MKGMAILLVDDEPLIRLSMVDALEAVGYDVHAVASGTEGLTVLREKSSEAKIWNHGQSKKAVQSLSALSAGRKPKTRYKRPANTSTVPAASRISALLASTPAPVSSAKAMLGIAERWF